MTDEQDDDSSLSFPAWVAEDRRQAAQRLRIHLVRRMYWRDARDAAQEYAKAAPSEAAARAAATFSWTNDTEHDYEGELRDVIERWENDKPTDATPTPRIDTMTHDQDHGHEQPTEQTAAAAGPEPVDTAGAKLNVQNCEACDGQHTALEIHAYKTPRPPHTHWYTCPRTGDPVQLTIVKYAGHNLHVSNDLVGDLARALLEGEFVIFTFWCGDDGKLHMQRRSQHFPIDQFGTVLRMVRQDLEKEAGPLERPTPAQPNEMPRAGTLSPLVQLFGGDTEAPTIGNG